MRFSEDIQDRISGKHLENLRMINFKNKKILDIGCGAGIFEQYVGSKAKRIIAIDVNKKDLETAKKNVKNRNVYFKELGISGIKNLGKEKFEVVCMLDVIEHLPKKSEIKALENIHYVLKKNGRLLISTPKKNASVFLDPAWYFGHRHYNRKQLENFLGKSSFEIEKIYSGGGIFEILSMFLFYFYKWMFSSEIPFKKWFDKRRNKEYGHQKGIVHWFAIARKI